MVRWQVKWTIRVYPGSVTFLESLRVAAVPKLPIGNLYAAISRTSTLSGDAEFVSVCITLSSQLTKVTKDRQTKWHF